MEIIAAPCLNCGESATVRKIYTTVVLYERMSNKEAIGQRYQVGDTTIVFLCETCARDELTIRRY